MENSKDNRILVALKLLKGAFGRYKYQLIVLTILGFLSGLLEGIGVNAIIPLFTFITPGASKATDTISKAIEKFFSVLHLNYTFTYLAGMIALLFLLKTIFTVVANYVSARITASYEKQMRADLFEKTLDTSWPYLLEQKIGHLEKILIDHVGNAAEALRLLSSSILLVTSLTMYVFVALNISAPITLLTLAFGGLLFLLLKPYLSKTRMVSQRFSETAKNVSHHINENMIGLKTVKALAAEKQVLQKGSEYFEDLKKSRVLLSFYQAISNNLVQPIGIIFILVVFSFYYKTPGFEIIKFAAVLYFIDKIFSYVQGVQGKAQSLYGFVPYLQSVTNLLQLAKKNKEKNFGQQPFNFEKTLEFKNISFYYNKDKEKILNNANFVLHKEERMGLIGPSGAGKTTIVDLLLRLFNPTNGEILIDGKNIDNISLHNWRKNIAYVSQDIFLINDTIESNIKFYDNQITQEKIQEAAKMANIYDFIMDQPQQFQTPVGERGVLLSAGQRQRIVLARMLARNPQILILDEATSALDNESEVLVQKAIENLKGKVTVFVIAHRLSTVLSADRILVLENGDIIEEGTPKKLLENSNSYFFKVYNLPGQTP